MKPEHYSNDEHQGDVVAPDGKSYALTFRGKREFAAAIVGPFIAGARVHRLDEIFPAPARTADEARLILAVEVARRGWK